MHGIEVDRLVHGEDAAKARNDGIRIKERSLMGTVWGEITCGGDDHMGRRSPALLSFRNSDAWGTPVYM